MRGYDEASLRHPIVDLAEGAHLMSAVYVFESDEQLHAKERKRAIELFKALRKTLALEEYGESVRQVFESMERTLERDFSPSSRLNPLLAHKEKMYFSIAMNPLYSMEHPRWAPVAMVVVTRHSDVAAIPEEVRLRIRRESQKRMGREYDADQLYI